MPRKSHPAMSRIDAHVIDKARWLILGLPSSGLCAAYPSKSFRMRQDRLSACSVDQSPKMVFRVFCGLRVHGIVCRFMMA